MSTIKTSGFAKSNNSLSPWLKGWWKLDEGSGLIINDSSGYNRWMKAAVTLSAGFWGTAGRGTFDGVSDRFNLLAGQFGQELDIGKFVNGVGASYAYSFRLKRNGNSASTGVIIGNQGRLTTPIDGIALRLTTSGYIEHLYAPNTGGDTYDGDVSMLSTDNVDHHIVFSLNRSTSKMRMYLDGVKKIEGTAMGAYTEAIAAAAGECGFSIGTRGFGNAQNLFSGQLWDMQLYTGFTALTDAQTDLIANLAPGVALTQAQLG
jgi:hypothetical protein